VNLKGKNYESEIVWIRKDMVWF